MASTELIEEWFTLTRETMPAAAKGRGWPVYLDHCFQRILLDNAVAGAWRDHIKAPAYRHAADRQLRTAISLGRRVMAGSADLHELNRQSLEWRGKL